VPACARTHPSNARARRNALQSSPETVARLRGAKQWFALVVATTRVGKSRLHPSSASLVTGPAMCAAGKRNGRKVECTPEIFVPSLDDGPGRRQIRERREARRSQPYSRQRRFANAQTKESAMLSMRKLLAASPLIPLETRRALTGSDSEARASLLELGVNDCVVTELLDQRSGADCLCSEE
jgi:hypothetical protein